ncbi:helix-turn-helix domain-containing protein [Rhodopila sp.]|uniref:helix-turn-helix domain-containing protein n=1 Tax=Rhodopila sp. TaxID=2480087 RepID=UPI003D12E725
MRRTEALQGVRVIKFRSEFERHEASELNQIDAAALLGVSERTFRRWCVRFDDAGESGLLDRRLGQVSGQRVPSEREAQIETLYRTRYSGFTAKHFHEPWCAITASPGATPGPRCFCNRTACCHAPQRAARIAASGRAGRCPG